MTYPEWKKEYIIKTKNQVLDKDTFNKDFIPISIEKPLNKGKVSDLYEIEIRGKTYTVDDKHVLLDYSNKEKEVADIIANDLGKDVYMMPRIEFPQHVKVADYRIEGESYDLKEITGKGKEVLYGNVKRNKEQSKHFIFEISKCPLDDNEILRQIEYIYKSTHTKFVEKIIIVKDGKITQMYERKK